MSGGDGWQQAGQMIGQGIAEHVNAPPLQKNKNRVIWGTWLVTFGCYVAYTLKMANRNIGTIDLVRVYFRILHEPLDQSWPFYAWGGVMLFGLLWVTVGMRGSRGPRDTMMAFWSLASLAIFGAALWYRWYPDDYPTVDWFLQGFYIAGATSSVMALFVSVRGPGRSAARLIQQQIVRQSRIFRLGRRKSF